MGSGFRAPETPSKAARPLSAEAPSHRWPEAIFWQLHSAKGNSPRAANHSPNAPRIEKATQAIFPPRPCALHRAMRGWAAPGSLGPAALLGVSGTRITLPMGTPWWGNRIGRAKAFCAQVPAMPPDPARPLRAKAPSQRWHITSFWELHSAKGNSPWATNHSLTVPRCRKSTQAVFAPAFGSPLGKAGLGCPWIPGPCCFPGGLRSPKRTPHGFSFAGNAGLGARKPPAPRPQPCPLSQLGHSAPRPRRTDCPK